MGGDVKEVRPPGTSPLPQPADEGRVGVYWRRCERVILDVDLIRENQHRLDEVIVVRVELELQQAAVPGDLPVHRGFQKPLSLRPRDGDRDVPIEVDGRCLDCVVGCRERNQVDHRQPPVCR